MWEQEIRRGMVSALPVSTITKKTKKTKTNKNKDKKQTKNKRKTNEKQTKKQNIKFFILSIDMMNKMKY